MPSIWRNATTSWTQSVASLQRQLPGGPLLKCNCLSVCAVRTTFEHMRAESGLTFVNVEW